MKQRICEFKSVPQRTREVPAGHGGAMVLRKEYDLAGVREHRLELSPGQILSHRAWIMNLLWAAMGISILFVLIYGALVVGFRVDFSSGAGRIYRAVYISAFLVSFLALWIALSVPGAVKGLKRSHVEAERGEGNWLLVDLKDWDRFYRIVTAPKKEAQPGRGDGRR
ncbi:MAG: hypothetical protein JXA20_06965 [Spirochaetes bacterium]|nr:hypothetical protein [Spirochaetota bacterium]